MAKPSLPYPLHYYDAHLALKPSFGLYLVLGYLLKSWLILIATLASRGDEAGLLLQWYSQQQHFVYQALSGLPALLLCIATFRRQPNAHPILRWLWQHGYQLLWLTGILQCLLLVQHISIAWRQLGWPVLIEAVVLCWLALYLYKNRFLRDLFASYPIEETSEMKQPPTD